MALTASALASLAFADHLATFPGIVEANRSNVTTGVPVHNIPEAFISALCEGIVDAVLQITVNDFASGAADPPGTAVPVKFTLPSKSAAIAAFLASQAWTGTQAALAANCLIGGPLTHLTSLATLHMSNSAVVGTGAGLVSPATNANLVATLTTLLNASLVTAFQASGKFGEGDVPTAPVNSVLLAQLPAYATAYATAIGSITAPTAYVGTAATTAPATGVVTGVIL